MKARLNYGRGRIEVEVEDRRVAALLEKRPAPALPDPGAAILAALDAPIGSRPLIELGGRGKRACVVVSDVTRPVPNSVILPAILARLEQGGVRREDVTILVATGMHRPGGQAELVELLGEEVVKTRRVINHRADDPDGLRFLGRTPRGTRAEVNRIYYEADLKILTGLIEPHFMAGYSGGRKSICPGVSGLASLEYSHGVDCLSDPRATTGVLEGNPFHEDALAVARLAGCDFIVNVVLDDQRRIAAVFAGAMEPAHLAGRRYVDQLFTARAQAPADVVLTTNAGHPLDLNFYQTVKGLYAALPVLKPGGTIVIASRCLEGLGSPRFLGLLEELWRGPDRGDFLEAHRRRFVADQWEVQKLIQVLERADFMIYSEGLDDRDAKLGGGRKVGSVEQGLELAFARHGPQAQVIIIPEGPYVLAELG